MAMKKFKIFTGQQLPVDFIVVTIVTSGWIFDRHLVVSSKAIGWNAEFGSLAAVAARITLDELGNGLKPLGDAFIENLVAIVHDLIDMGFDKIVYFL